MREILFRGKTVDNKEWVYGDFTHNIRNQAFISEGLADIIYAVIPETVGQYIGLTDKNGEKIFEGDIVKLFEQTGEIVFECGAFGIGFRDTINWDWLASEIESITGCNNRPYFCQNDNFISLWELMWNYNQEENGCYVVEVIGNIHDNPELLEVSENEK